MGNFFGIDFVDTKPTDADFAEHTTDSYQGADELRDLKTRIKAFWDVMFDLETGLFDPGAVAQTMLKALTPDPAGTFRQVNINRKGQVTSGVENPPGFDKMRLRAYYSADPDTDSYIELRDGGYEALTAQDQSGYYTLPGFGDAKDFYWFAPEKVTRLTYWIWQPTDQAYKTAAVTHGNGATGTIIVTPGQRVTLTLANIGARAGVTAIEMFARIYTDAGSCGVRNSGWFPFPPATGFGYPMFMDEPVSSAYLSAYSQIPRSFPQTSGVGILEWYEV